MKNITELISERFKFTTPPIYKPIKINDEYVILGEMHGVYLKKRDKHDDDYAMITILIGSGSFWTVSKNLEFSSYWLEDHIKVLKVAKLLIGVSGDFIQTYNKINGKSDGYRYVN